SADDTVAELTAVGTSLFFRIQTALWKSDGTPAGTLLVKDFASALSPTAQQIRAAPPAPGDGIAPQLAPPSPSPPLFLGGLINVHGRLFFEATAGAQGNGLWTSDGTAEGTVLLQHSAELANGDYFIHPLDVDGTLFFMAQNTTSYHYELWKS